MRLVEKVCGVCASTFSRSSTQRRTYCSEDCRVQRARAAVRACASKQPKIYHQTRIREWEQKNIDRVRSNHYKARYGITLEELEHLLVSQNNSCAICGCALRLRGVKGRDMPVVDHCHDIGKVRGILCTPCNLMLGYAKDNCSILEQAITYLKGN